MNSVCFPSLRTFFLNQKYQTSQVSILLKVGLRLSILNYTWPILSYTLDYSILCLTIISVRNGVVCACTHSVTEGSIGNPFMLENLIIV